MSFVRFKGNLFWIDARFLGQEIIGNLSACLCVDRIQDQPPCLQAKRVQDVFVESAVCVRVWRTQCLQPHDALRHYKQLGISNYLSPSVVTQMWGGVGEGSPLPSSAAHWEMASIHLVFPLWVQSSVVQQGCRIKAVLRGGVEELDNADTMG